jgi:cytochrome P450
VTAKRSAPGDDMLSGLVHDADPPLTDAQLTDMALVLLAADHETTASMLGAFALLENPDQLAALRAGPNLLLDGPIDELLRYLSIVQMGVPRVATEDVTIAGVAIPAGSTLIIAMSEVNRDPRHWDEPDRLDVLRPRTSHLVWANSWRGWRCGWGWASC